MILSAARICKVRHAAAAFDGVGALLEPGRWNSIGRRMVYTSECPALALLEIMVHADYELMHSYALFSLTFDDTLVEVVDSGTLPPGWKFMLEPAWARLQHIGTDWLESLRTPILRVPTVLVPDQFNYLLNPTHPDFAKISIGLRQNLVPDPRLRSTP